MKARSTRRALLTSLLSLLLCVAMLMGTTYAWFTDSVTSAGNKIMAGNLDVKLYYYDGTNYVDISTSDKPLFGADGLAAAADGSSTLWEPNKTQVVYLAIENAGSLALKYKVALNVTDVEKDLTNVLEYAITPDAKPDSAPVTAWDEAAANGQSANRGTQIVSGATAVPMQPGDMHYFALSVHMLSEAGNAYMNGSATFDLTVLASQLASEEDSFGKDYDIESLFPGQSAHSALGTEDIVLVTEGDQPAKVTLSAALVTKLAAKNIEAVALKADNVTVKTTAGSDTVDVSFGAVDLLDEDGAKIDLTGNTEPIPVKLYVGTEFAGKYAAIEHDGVAVATSQVDAEGYISYQTTHFCRVDIALTDEEPKAEEIEDIKPTPGETAPEEDLTELVTCLVGNHYYTVSRGMAYSWYENPAVPGQITASIYVPEDLIAYAMMYRNGDLAETGSHSDLTLVNDLDFTEYNWVPIGRFYTNIHGNSKTVSNLNDSFFGCVYDCHLDNITIENVTASGSASGVLGKELAGDIYFTNVTVAGNNTVTYVQDNATNWPEGGTGVGALCGVSLIGCAGLGNFDVTITGTIEVNYQEVFCGNTTNLENLGVSKELGLNVYKENSFLDIKGSENITTNGQCYLFDPADLEDGFALDTLTGCYYVFGAEGLATFAAAVNGGENFLKKTVVLYDSIDLAYEEWTPIGNSTNIFKGTFDGNGKTVSNLLITGYRSDVGLFGFTTDGEIKNLTVENAMVSGRLDVGVVAGTPYTSKYTNITVKGLVKVDGMSYVGAVGGKNAYASWDRITVDVAEGSYVKANSVEDGTAYRTYVGGVIGFMGEGTHKVTNVTSNIDVTGSTCDVGGIVGIAHEGNTFENILCTGDVTITGATDDSDIEEIGGIAGVWMNKGRNVSFNNCRFTGKLSVSLAEDSTAQAAPDLSNNTITGKGYYTTTDNKLIIDGKEVMTVDLTPDTAEDPTADQVDALQGALNNNADGYLSIESNVNGKGDSSNSYGNTGLNVAGNQTIDGNGNTLSVTDCNSTWDSAVNITGGAIKNLTIDSGFRGVFINHNSETCGKVYLENVIIDGPTYTISCDQGTGNGLEAVGCTFNGWTSYAATLGEAKFVECSFGEGAGYAYARPYAPTAFVNCDFEAGYVMDARAAVTFENCTIGGEPLTADNLATLVINNIGNATVIK